MNEETRLILYSLKWVIERDTFNEELRKEMCNECKMRKELAKK